MPIKGYKLWLESTAQPAWGKRGRVTTGVELDDYVDLGEKFDGE